MGSLSAVTELVANDARCSTRNPMLAEVDQPGIGRYLRATSPISFGRSPRVAPARSPRMGEDADAVLTSWLDLAPRDVAALQDEGVVGRVTE